MITIDVNPILSIDHHCYLPNNTALGNHMFQYAVCRLVAEKNKYDFFIPDIGYLSKTFPSLQLISQNKVEFNKYQNYASIPDVKQERDLAIGMNKFFDESTQKYNSKVFTISDNTIMYGFYQSEKYFEGNHELIKSWFILNDSINVDKYTNEYPIDKYCYIHIRGKDYITLGWSLPKKYYQESMSIMIEKFPNISFLIITDDVNLSASMFPDISIISDSILVDFKLLYISKYCIISNSTFSWWTSWLSDKIITIAPNNWIHYNNPSSGFFPEDIKSDKFIYV